VQAVKRPIRQAGVVDLCEPADRVAKICFRARFRGPIASLVVREPPELSGRERHRQRRLERSPRESDPPSVLPFAAADSVSELRTDGIMSAAAGVILLPRMSNTLRIVSRASLPFANLFFICSPLSLFATARASNSGFDPAYVS
jgi:hypothetical protein